MVIMDVKEFSELEKDQMVSYLSTLNDEIKKEELELFELQAEKNAYDFKTEEVTSQIKFQIASEKDDKDKKKFSNDLERELEFKKRFDVTMYNSIIAEKLKNITTKGLALNHAKNIFSLYFEFFVKLA